jgi:hypothetical protein
MTHRNGMQAPCPNPIHVSYQSESGDITTAWKPCGRWHCPACAELKRAEWTRCAVLDLQGTPQDWRYLECTRDEWKTRVWPVLQRAARILGQPIRYYAVWGVQDKSKTDETCCADTVRIWTPLPIGGSRLLRREAMAGLLEAIANVHPGDRPVTCSRGWGPGQHKKAPSGHTFLGYGATKAKIIAAVQSADITGTAPQVFLTPLRCIVRMVGVSAEDRAEIASRVRYCCRRACLDAKTLARRISSVASDHARRSVEEALVEAGNLAFDGCT